jgi:2-amino-4-hydroxy-6-hydroxymethyldihydropteridine diphosphokinase
VEWAGDVRELLKAVKDVEREGGRKPTRRWGPRIIDVDILLFGDERISRPNLEVPHPGISQRPFVLESLRELGVRPAQVGRALVKR